jgi:hypothetical protein
LSRGEMSCFYVADEQPDLSRETTDSENVLPQ